MKLRWAAPSLLVLALGALVPAALSAQDTTQTQRRPRSAGGLDQNYPNPFNPETRIPFSVGDYPTCKEPSRRYRVTLRIYNLLAQQVATPILLSGSSGGTDENPFPGRGIENLSLSCGRYLAYWDGKYQVGGREVASGIYIYRLEIDGRMSGVKKMVVAK